MTQRIWYHLSVDFSIPEELKGMPSALTHAAFVEFAIFPCESTPQ